MPVLFRATPWQDLTNGRFVHKPTTVVAGHSRDTPVRPSTLRTTDAPRTHPPSGQSVLARPAAALRRRFDAAPLGADSLRSDNRCSLGPPPHCGGALMR